MGNRNIRNFCIIAHIDHGKSTLADRFLELTNTVSKKDMQNQILDSMDLERERGITIKMQPVSMRYVYKGNEYILNLIDTPGHVDFSYEVSRALAAVEGAILLVDACKGIQAQTLANLYMALDQDLSIIPVINKIDLKAADLKMVSKEIESVLGVKKDEIMAISAKTGLNVENVLRAVIDKIPDPGSIPKPESGSSNFGRLLIFDSYYDKHKGVVCDVRVFDGEVAKGLDVVFYQTKAVCQVKEVGVYTPRQTQKTSLKAGEIGYIATGIKDVGKCQVGDTIVTLPSFNSDQKLKVKLKSEINNMQKFGVKPLSGYKRVKPVVFANIYPKDQDKFFDLKQAIEELKLNDSSLDVEPASSFALGKGFKLGALGLLHLDIIKERIFREYDIEIILTVPQVEYRIKYKSGKLDIITSPQEFPDNTSQIESVLEPWVELKIITPSRYIGPLMRLIIERRGEYINTDYLLGASSLEEVGDDKMGIIEHRAILHLNLPMSELLTDFYDKLKSVSRGYASLNYKFKEFRKSDLVKLKFIIAGEEEKSLAMLVYKDFAYNKAKKVLSVLKEEIPPHLFEIRLQAAIFGKVIASERIRAIRKDVTAKLYGGDVTRKIKLLKKQAKGKKRMASLGKVDIPSRAYLAVLKR